MIGASPPLDLSVLSPRQREVVEMLARGVRLPDIARRMGVAQHTARNHLKTIFKKLRVGSQIELLSMVSGAALERARCIDIVSREAALSAPGPVQDKLCELVSMLQHEEHAPEQRYAEQVA